MVEQEEIYNEGELVVYEDPSIDGHHTVGVIDQSPPFEMEIVGDSITYTDKYRMRVSPNSPMFTTVSVDAVVGDLDEVEDPPHHNWEK